MEGNELLGVTIIIRMPLSMAASYAQCRGKVLISTLCSDTICFANKHCGGVRGEMASYSRWRTLKREVSDAAEWAPVSPKSVQLSCCIHNAMHSPYILPTFNPCLREGRLRWASCCQQPTVTALSAVPLIIAQRSLRVEPNCGVHDVNGAKTSEESPLKDNKKTADWLQTTQREIRTFHMNINVILTGNLPQERTEKTAEETEQGKESENKWKRE